MATRRGNPPSSEWFSTPAAKRKAPVVGFTLDGATNDLITALAEKAHGGERGRSAAVREAVRRYARELGLLPDEPSE